MPFFNFRYSKVWGLLQKNPSRVLGSSWAVSSDVQLSRLQDQRLTSKPPLESRIAGGDDHWMEWCHRHQQSGNPGQWASCIPDKAQRKHPFPKALLVLSSFIFFFLFSFLFSLMAAPIAYGRSQARDRIEATAAAYTATAAKLDPLTRLSRARD